jgi:hypothetical protein
MIPIPGRPHCFIAATQSPAAEELDICGVPFVPPEDRGFQLYHPPCAALGALVDVLDDGPPGGAIARMEINRDPNDGCPERLASRPNESVESPLSYYLSLPSSGTAAERNYWREAADFYSDLHQCWADVSGKDLCWEDDLAGENPALAYDQLRDWGKYEKTGVDKIKGCRQSTGLQHPDLIKAKVPPNGFDAFMVARIDARALLHKAHKALSRRVVRPGRAPTFKDITDWTIMDGRTARDIGIFLAIPPSTVKPKLSRS